MVLRQSHTGASPLQLLDYGRRQQAILMPSIVRTDQPGDPPLSSLWSLRSLDGGHVFALEAKGQALEGRTRLPVAAQGLGEVRRPSDDLGAVSSSRSTTTMSPSAIPLAVRFAALIPIRHCPRIPATLLRHVWPLIVAVIGGRRPQRRASATLFGISTPVALPEGMTLALNFMFASSYPCSDPEGTPSRPRQWSSLWQTVSACAAESLSPARAKKWPARPSREPYRAVGSTTGRISIDPYLLEGQRCAQLMASSRLGASTKKKPANCSFVSAYGPSSTSDLPSRWRTVVAAELGCNRSPGEEPSALASA